MKLFYQILFQAGYSILLGFYKSIYWYWINYLGFGKVKTGLASLTLMSEPVTAAFLAWLILGEYLSAIQFFGGIIILFGIIYAQSSSELKQ